MKRLVSLRTAFVRLAVLSALLQPAVAAAQDKESPKDKASHWGVRFYVTPSWEITESTRKLLFEEGETGTMKGTEFAIGLTRGSTLGGDWGVSFVRKRFDDESALVETDQDCFNQAQTICRPNVSTTQFDGVYLNAVEVHWYKPFVTIKRRAQIGMNIAGGVGSMKGNVIKKFDFFQPTGFNQNGPTGFTPFHDEEVIPAEEELLSTFPLGKIEVAGGVILAPGLKVHAAWGLNFPGAGFRVGAVYLFGAQ